MKTPIFFFHGHLASTQSDTYNYDAMGNRSTAAFSRSAGVPPTLQRTRTWGNDISGSPQSVGGVGGLLLTEEITSTTTTAYHFAYDGNGNVTEITDASGNPAASYRYDAFGNTLVSTGSYATSNRYRFSTKPLDSEVTNAPLYYYGYRYYDPLTGRWPSRDPIEEEGGLNLYGFVGNDGVNGWDLLGNIKSGEEIPVTCGGFLGIIGVKAGGKITVSDYSITEGNHKKTGLPIIQATLDMTFAPASGDCCCKGGTYQWYQTITRDDEFGNAPRPDTGDAESPNLAPLKNLHFKDSPKIQVNRLINKYNTDQPRNRKVKFAVKFKTELQCVQDGKTKTLKTIKWGFWAQLERIIDPWGNKTSSVTKGLD